MDVETLVIADMVRKLNGTPVTPSSGARCADHNKKVGGAHNSQHVKCRAMDLPVKDPKYIFDKLCQMYPGKYGFGLYETFVHVDTRSNGPARWKG